MKRRITAGLLCLAIIGGLGACHPASDPASSGGKPSTSDSTIDTSQTGVTTTDILTSDSSASATGSLTNPTTDSSKTKPVPGSKPATSSTTTTTRRPTAPSTTPNPGDSGTPAAVDKALVPLNSEEDSLLWKNPDRGYRLDAWCDLDEMAIVKDPKALMKSRILEKEPPEGIPMVCQTYIYLSGYNDRDIPPKALEALGKVFEAHEEMGIRMQPRFCYAKNINDPLTDAPQEIMLRHIKQIAPVIKEWSHVIQFFPICFIGAWGEWHGEYYDIDKALVARTVMEQLVVPNNLYALIRLPAYKNLLKGTPYYDRIGIENDSIFGKIMDMGYGTGGLDGGSDQWVQLVKEAAYTPQEGELYLQEWFADGQEGEGVEINNLKVLEQLSEHRFTTLSLIHSYVDAGAGPNTNIGKWKKEIITESWLKSKGIQYDPAWFRNKAGQTVTRNMFDFVKDHLGYKLVAQRLKVTGGSKPASTITVEMPLINYGFAAAFNLESGFAILDANNKVVSTVKSGNPETWYNRNPDDYTDSRNLTHTLRASMKLPGKAGRYKLAFFLKNTGEQYARLSNRLTVVNGYHILHEFDVR